MIFFGIIFLLIAMSWIKGTDILVLILCMYAYFTGQVLLSLALFLIAVFAHNHKKGVSGK